MMRINLASILMLSNHTELGNHNVNRPIVCLQLIPSGREGDESEKGSKQLETLENISIDRKKKACGTMITTGTYGLMSRRKKTAGSQVIEVSLKKHHRSENTIWSMHIV